MIIPPPFSLTNKLILITGASSGIGRQCAISCSKMEARVVLFGRDKVRLEETLGQMVHKEKHAIFSFDLLDNAALEQAVSEIVGSMGKIDGLINAAGISTTLPLKMVNTPKMEHFFQTNVFGAINLTRLCTKSSNMATNGASIVFLTSVMASVGESGKSLYAMTKGALLAATKSLAIELASKNIRVNCISPGVVITPMSQKSAYSQDEEALNLIKSYHPLGLGVPEDVANASIFLLSAASRWITGTDLIIDGGYSAR
jgi:NAD(P)-dependent dehydrogenase (short-subunit alcohol dehydrogenase family)